jgi:ribosomal protein S20
MLTVLCLGAALTLSSCGNKEATTTTTTTTTTPAATTPAATAPVTGTAPTTAPATGTAAPLTAIEKTQLTPVKTALVMANSAIKTGDMAKAKTQFDKFSSLFPAVEPILKAKAGASYPAIANGIAEFKTATSGATPNKDKAAAGLNAAIKAMDAIVAKK